ncbi:cupin domain-containing protein [Rhodobium gokarnense]|uniref:Cupin superfamily protein n=1 Tax=Rhodobium gokarnense TaxID=364296 RepID=A0ABT3H9K0_9HYPH|nr:cupin domain-containing protein [Rhodobium gokarnense]MCW2307080.1 putative cupin superfamily protein [Rhodobium gokarnense]
MPKVDIEAMEWQGGSSYPSPYRERVAGRVRKRLGDAGGLSQFGANLTRLDPGAMSALRHWHQVEDEFVFVVEGEVVLIEDDGETPMTAGDAATFKAGVANGHHFVNRSDRPALYLEVGTRSPTERANYPDDDLAGIKEDGRFVFTRKDGSSFD